MLTSQKLHGPRWRRSAFSQAGAAVGPTPSPTLGLTPGPTLGLTPSPTLGPTLYPDPGGRHLIPT